MANYLLTDSQWTELDFVAKPPSQVGRISRVSAAFALTNGPLPNVSENAVLQYYEYLFAHLKLPFAAYYPAPRNSAEESQFRCDVIELLSPSEHLGDLFDGIFCRTRKGTYEINLPLIELQVVRGNPNFQLIDDFRFWFWNWR
jgi:hypothetical protein